MLLIAGSVAHAADPAVTELRQQVDELTRRVDMLQQRVDALASGAGKGTAACGSAAGCGPAGSGVDLIGLRRAWRRVEPGKSESDVKSALGAPSRELRINGKRVWYYVYPDVGAGSVFFNDDGHVSSARSPSLGWDN